MKPFVCLDHWYRQIMAEKQGTEPRSSLSYSRLKKKSETLCVFGSLVRPIMVATQGTAPRSSLMR